MKQWYALYAFLYFCDIDICRPYIYPGYSPGTVVIILHAYVITRKYVPRYWPVVRGIIQSRVDPSHKRPAKHMHARTNAWTNSGIAVFRRHERHVRFLLQSSNSGGYRHMKHMIPLKIHEITKNKTEQNKPVYIFHGINSIAFCCFFTLPCVVKDFNDFNVFNKYLYSIFRTVLVDSEIWLGILHQESGYSTDHHIFRRCLMSNGSLG